jgi:hypothetical protein
MIRLDWLNKYSLFTAHGRRGVRTPVHAWGAPRPHLIVQRSRHRGNFLQTVRERRINVTIDAWRIFFKFVGGSFSHVDRCYVQITKLRLIKVHIGRLPFFSSRQGIPINISDRRIILKVKKTLLRALGALDSIMTPQ